MVIIIKVALDIHVPIHLLTHLISSPYLLLSWYLAWLVLGLLTGWLPHMFFLSLNPPPQSHIYPLHLGSCPSYSLMFPSS